MADVPNNDTARRDNDLRLSTTRWVLYRCVECDPTEDNLGPHAHEYDEPYQWVMPDPDADNYDPYCPLDYCPRCGDNNTLKAQARVTVTTAGAPTRRSRPTT